MGQPGIGPADVFRFVEIEYKKGTSPHSPNPPPAPATTPTPPPGSRCPTPPAPGATSPAVTQAAIGQTICKGQVTLVAAQQAIAAGRTTAEARLGIKSAAGGDRAPTGTDRPTSGTDSPPDCEVAARRDVATTRAARGGAGPACGAMSWFAFLGPALLMAGRA